MKQIYSNSLSAAIDALRDEIRRESVEGRYYPVVQFVVLMQYHYPNGKIGVRPLVTLNRVKDGVPVELDSYRILKPENREPLDIYINRLEKHLNYLDDHALFVEIV